MLLKPLSYMFFLCSSVKMTDSPQITPPTKLLPDEELLAFTAVPLDRKRNNGWTPAQQERFIVALSVMGSVGQAVKAVGMSRQSAYNSATGRGRRALRAVGIWRWNMGGGGSLMRRWSGRSMASPPSVCSVAAR
jgi:hypothetical protein